MQNKQFKNYIDANSNSKYKNYVFMKSKSGFLAYRHNLSPLVRATLNKIRYILGWLCQKQSENEEFNKQVLRSIGLSENSDVSKLDAVHKQQFKKRKFIKSFKPRPQKDLSEPKVPYYVFIPGEQKFKSSLPSEEFLKAFKKQK